MKLYYHRDPNGLRNFGDDLNPWLWSRIVPELLNNDDSTMFIGFGTLLNERLPSHLPRDCRKVVFSTGVGYGSGYPPRRDSTWHYYCVRGPLSAARLGLRQDLGIVDGAVLVRRLVDPLPQKRHARSFMPHALCCKLGGNSWRRLCERADLHFIDPRESVESVLDQIASSEVLFTEAMHGAIVADALGVPWLPFVSHPVNVFKWKDWSASVDLPYSPWKVPAVWDGPGARRTVRKFLKETLVTRKLLAMCRHGRPMLSHRSRMETLTCRLEAKIEELRRDEAIGRHRSLRI